MLKINGDSLWLVTLNKIKGDLCLIHNRTDLIHFYHQNHNMARIVHILSVKTNKKKYKMKNNFNNFMFKKKQERINSSLLILLKIILIKRVVKLNLIA